MKHHIIITRKAFHTIRKDVFLADDNFEIGGVLIGYQLIWIHIIVAVTTPNKNKCKSRISFLLDGAEHMQKANNIISGYMCSPTLIGIWHSHICDGHKFSKQDIYSNRILAKSLGGALSMLVTKHVHTLALSVSHISISGNESDCAIIVL